MPASGRAHYRWSSGNGKVWRRRQTLGTVGSSGSNGKVWRLRQGLEVAARSGGSSKLWRRLKALDVVVSKLWRKRETLEMVEGSRCSGKQALEVVASFEVSLQTLIVTVHGTQPVHVPYPNKRQRCEIWRSISRRDRDILKNS